MTEDPKDTEPADREFRERGGAMRSVIASRVCGTPPNMIMDRTGILVLYMTAMLIPPGQILFLVSLFSLTAGFLTLVSSYYADRFGPKKLGTIGALITVAAFCGVILAGFSSRGRAALVMGCCIVLYSLGASMLGGGWLALMHPLIPEGRRGRFLGTLRLCVQLVVVAVSIPLAFLLAEDSPAWLFQVIFIVPGLLLLLRLHFYRRVPQMDAPAPEPEPLRKALAEILRVPGYVPFIAYVFLLALVTRNAPVLFCLLEKEILGFGDGVIVAAGFAVTVGGMVGLALGGRVVDRYGTRVAFVACHLAFGLLFGLFLLRDMAVPLVPGLFDSLLQSFTAPVSGSLFLYVSALQFLFGLVLAVSNLAVTTELFAIMPRKNKALASGISTSMIRMGIAFAGMLSAWILNSGILAARWSMGGSELSAYDSLLLLSAAVVVVLVVTLGLVPSVIGKSRWEEVEP